MGVVQVGFYLINLVVDDSYTWWSKVQNWVSNVILGKHSMKAEILFPRFRYILLFLSTQVTIV